MAEELRAARQAVAEAPADEQAQGVGTEGVGPWPSWHVSPSWLPDAERPGGSSLVQQLRGEAVRGAQEEGSRVFSAAEWQQLRAAVQASVVRRQVQRTQVAATHAQLMFPLSLPPAVPAGPGRTPSSRVTSRANPPCSLHTGARCSKRGRRLRRRRRAARRPRVALRPQRHSRRRGPHLRTFPRLQLGYGMTSWARGSTLAEPSLSRRSYGCLE